MASLNLSANGPSISASYQKIVASPLPTGPAASSPTYAQWALYSVQSPLANAFQPTDVSKESVLKVQTTGEGELRDLVDDFSDGRIQFAFVKVKDPNTTLPKNVLIAWCGEGVPERTKGYFTSHLNAVVKVLHGYHVQVTARSDRDLTPEGIVQKVADASGSRYSGASASTATAPPPPVASKPIMPTKSFGAAAGGFQPLASQRTRQLPSNTQTGDVDADGWGADAPRPTRSQLEKVASAYQPTKVDMKQLQSQTEPSRYQTPPQSSNNNGDDAGVVRGAYQPVGKVDIAALRRQAQEEYGRVKDERPTVVKGAYEPVGKVDIADIRRKAQGAPSVAQTAQPAPQQQEEADGDNYDKAPPNPSFSSAERLTSLPRPQVSNRFSASSSNSFSGSNTVVPSNSGKDRATVPTTAPIGIASRTFADQGGKTPAQQWEENRRRQRGLSGAGADSSQPPASPITTQTSGGWQSGYGGKKWGVQIPTRTGGSGTGGVANQHTGDNPPPVQEEEEERGEREDPEDSEAGARVGEIRDRFSREPPALHAASKPNASTVSASSFATADVPRAERQNLPPPPARPLPADEREAEAEEDNEQPPSPPARIAMPVARAVEPFDPLPKASALVPSQPLPTASLAQVASEHKTSADPEADTPDPARSAAQAAALSTFGSSHASGAKTLEAVAQYDYEKDEANELQLREGEKITNIEMVDEDWWTGRNERGEEGLFPSNYVELVGGGAAGGAAGPVARSEVEEPASAGHAAPVAHAPAAAAAGGKSAIAQFDYEAAEDNELSFPENARLTDLEFPDDDWWFGHYGGKSGLFPANYVELEGER